MSVAIITHDSSAVVKNKMIGAMVNERINPISMDFKKLTIEDELLRLVKSFPIIYWIIFLIIKL